MLLVVATLSLPALAQDGGGSAGDGGSMSDSGAPGAADSGANDSGNAADSGSPNTPDAATGGTDAATPPADAGPEVVETCSDNLSGGTVDTFGVCHDGDAVWCSDNAFVRLTCDSLDDFFAAPDAGMLSQAGVCQVFDDVGSWCVFEEGAQCYVGENSLPFGCGEGAASTTMGCDISDGCVTGMVACTPDADFAPTCQGDRLVLDCTPWGQPLSINCASAEIGGTTCQNDVCVGLPQDVECAPGLTSCAAGLECTDVDAITGVGVCAPPPAVPDAGSGNGGGNDAGGGNGGPPDAGDNGGGNQDSGGGGSSENGGENGTTNGGAGGNGGDEGENGDGGGSCASLQIRSTGLPPAGLALVLLLWRVGRRRRGPDPRPICG
jgi:hypothetical protein